MSLSVEAQLSEVVRTAQRIYGPALPDVSGVLHVVSAARVDTPVSAVSIDTAEPLHAIRIGEHAPRSDTDFFVLNFWRAHCDAILTTAQVARAEPSLSHALQGPLAQGLEAYRERVLGKSKPPLCALLSASGEISPAHPMFRDALDYLILTTPAVAPQLRAAFAAQGTQGAKRENVEVLTRHAWDVRSALSLLGARGARTLQVEAGPSTAAQLYAAPCCVDHLMLSRFAGSLPPQALGPALPEDARLFRDLQLESTTACQEPSGRWHFQHWSTRSSRPAVRRPMERRLVIGHIKPQQSRAIQRAASHEPRLDARSSLMPLRRSATVRDSS